jgi:hypothetical protein
MPRKCRGFNLMAAGWWPRPMMWGQQARLLNSDLIAARIEPAQSIVGNARFLQNGVQNRPVWWDWRA